MKHVRQTELVRLAANELADDERAAVERHLAHCDACRAAYEAQAKVWGALGAWSLSDTPRDLLPGIERKLASPTIVLRPRGAALRSIGRVAAAILIGVGVGYVAGRSRSPTSVEAPAVISSATEGAAMEVLGLEHLSNPSPAGLYGTLLQLAAESEPEEGQS